MNRRTKGARFKAMHRGDGAFIMPNAWNAGSAALLEQAGFDAIGTTSAGIAYARALARATFGVIREAAEEMLRRGTFTFAGRQVPDAELCALFSRRTERAAADTVG